MLILTFFDRSLRIDFDDMTISGPFANLAVRRLSFMPENQTEDIGWYYRDNSHWCEYGVRVRAEEYFMLIVS